jgi:hypothetical protein
MVAMPAMAKLICTRTIFYAGTRGELHGENWQRIAFFREIIEICCLLKNLFPKKWIKWYKINM